MLLSITNSPQQSKQMLQEESELSQENDKNLFGEKFRELINDRSCS